MIIVIVVTNIAKGVMSSGSCDSDGGDPKCKLDDYSCVIRRGCVLR